MSAHVLLDFIKRDRERDKMLGLSSILSLFRNEFNKSNITVARMLDSIYHRMLKLLKNRVFVFENVKSLPSFTQHYNERYYVALLDLYTTSGLSILLHAVISLQDATSYDISSYMSKTNTNLFSEVYLFLNWKVIKQKSI